MIPIQEPAAQISAITDLAKALVPMLADRPPALGLRFFWPDAPKRKEATFLQRSQRAALAGNGHAKNICANRVSTRLAVISFGGWGQTISEEGGGLALMIDLRNAGVVRRRAVSAASLLLALIALTTTPSVGDSVPEAPQPSMSGSGPFWSDLTPSQQATLQPLMSTWPRFDPARKQRWLLTAANLTRLSKQEQARAASRMSAWADLTMLQRTRIRVQFICAKSHQKARQERSTAGIAVHDKLSGSSLPVVVAGPAMIQVGPGATTIMLSQNLKSTGAICPPSTRG
jgi:Protein of unknown function (DUF3106)